jgi:hypothetical protein
MNDTMEFIKQPEEESVWQAEHFFVLHLQEESKY